MVFRVASPIAALVLAAVFALGAGTGAMAQDGYTIRPGDTLQIEVLEDPGLNRTALVLPDGGITFPMAGSLQAGGRTIDQLRQNLSAALAPNFAVEPNVYVSVAALAQERAATGGGAAAKGPVMDVFAVGQVAVPGRIETKQGTTLLQFLAEVGGHPDHEVRQSIDVWVRAFAERLKDDPELLAKGEELKRDLIEHPEVRRWLETLWLGMKRGITEAATDADSELRERMTTSLQRIGERLAAEPELQRKVDSWVERSVAYVVEHYRSEVSDLIASTVERWDGESTARKMELQVGRDLQFIRINGTLVGGLAGLVIHALSELL